MHLIISSRIRTVKISRTTGRNRENKMIVIDFYVTFSVIDRKAYEISNKQKIWTHWLMNYYKYRTLGTTISEYMLFTYGKFIPMDSQKFRTHDNS